MYYFALKCMLLNLVIHSYSSFTWGFFGHQKINYHAVFLLPPEMMIFFKPHVSFLKEHAVDPDKRRYAITVEGPRHYIDLDHYGKYPFDSLPRNWEEAIAKYSEDSLNAHGIVPWWIMVMKRRLTAAFKEKNGAKILKLSADIGHYISDAHVPLHTSSNHNGQQTGQHGIHGFWESRIPELLAEKEWNFFTVKAQYLEKPLDFIWNRLLESARATDTVLLYEKLLTATLPPDKKFAFEERNGKIIRQYSSDFSKAYNQLLQGMVERRMRMSIVAVACFWFTAWVDAGQPNLYDLVPVHFTKNDTEEFERLTRAWTKNEMKGRKEGD